MLLTLLAGVALLGRPLDFYSDGPYDPSVPRPETILGYGPGERHTNYRDQERVVDAIAEAAKTRVRKFVYGKTPEGRPLRIFAIGSPKNIARLEEIRQQHADLAEGKGDPLKTVPIVWINQCIHGDETASFESGMWTMYNLAAARGGRLAKALENEVVIFNPVYNPDGHERYVVYYNSIATGSGAADSYEQDGPNVMFGRANHFRFDMNRDRVAFSQDETKAEFAAMLRWGPQVYIDQHGQVSSYFFPPEPMSINVNVDRARNAKWTEILGRATAKAFDERGFTYYVKDRFDFYYPGYLDASTALTGAIGMTHETDGGRYLARDRADGSTLTLRQGVEKHFTSALAVVVATEENGAGLLTDYAKFKRDAVTGKSAGKFQRVVMEGDPRALRRLDDQLRSAGIRTLMSANSWSQSDAHDYWSTAAGKMTFRGGSLVVDIAQPQGPLAKTLLEPFSDFEPEFIKEQVGKRKAVPEGEKYPGPEGSEFYDFTGWALPYAHGLKAWWCESAPAFPAARGLTGKPTLAEPAASPVGYALRYTDQEDILAVAEAMRRGVRAGITPKPMTLAGVTYPAGTFLFLSGRNDDGYERTLREVALDRGLKLEPLTTAYPDVDRSSPGNQSIIQLRRPNIAVVFGTTGNLNQVGALWFLMERVFRLPFTPITQSALSSGDLSKYTCIVMPNGSFASSSGRLRDWVAQGNVLVSLESIDWALGSSGFVELERVKGDPQGLPGSLFRAEIDARSFLSLGYSSFDSGKIEVAVPVQGNRFFLSRKEGGSVVQFSADEKVTKLLTGWAWPDDTEKALRGTVFVQDAPVGRGHAVLFTQDPTERAMWPGLYKMLLDAMIIGSGD